MNPYLKDRAQLFAAARQFFAEKEILEVDCLAIQPFAAVDAQIDSISVDLGQKKKGYLHTSPEYAMKKLIGKGSGSIYQMSHVFRKSEFGMRHHPEFMMAEWYHLGIDYRAFIDETADFIRLFLPELRTEMISYRELFQKYLDFDPFLFSSEDLIKVIHHHKIDAFVSDDDPKDTLLQLLLSHIIEPQLGEDHLLVLSEYPASQAALAQTVIKENVEVAKRFEIYHQGLELANGYHELTCAKEQRRRFHEENTSRIAMGKDAYHLDESFLNALESGLPDCCGVSVGFDRLMMLRHQKKNISEVLPH